MKFPSQLKIIYMLGLLGSVASFLLLAYMVVEALYTGQVTFYGREGNGVAYWIRQPGLFLYGIGLYSVFAAICGFAAWKALDVFSKDFE